MQRETNETACGNPHEKRSAKLLAEFGKANVGAVVEVDVCSRCGVYVKSKAIGLDDEGAWMIPSALAEFVEVGERELSSRQAGYAGGEN